MITRLHSTLFYSKNLDTTVEFYKKLGFEIQKSGDTARIKMGDFTLAFIDENKTPIKNDSGKEPKGLGVFTYIEVENVDEYFKSLQDRGIKTSSEPRDWPWGKREFAVKDPDGYKLIFYSSI